MSPLMTRAAIVSNMKVYFIEMSNLLLQVKNQTFIICRFRAMITHFEDEYLKLKAVTTLLELTLRKYRMNENISQSNSM